MSQSGPSRGRNFGKDLVNNAVQMTAGSMGIFGREE